MIIEKYNEENIFVKNTLNPYFKKFYKLVDAYYNNLVNGKSKLSHFLGIECDKIIF